MKIVVLDGHTLNPGDLTWDSLQGLGELVLYERTSVSDIVKRAADADIILTNKVPLSAATIEALPQLKYIGVTATGYNIIDIDCAKERNITITNVPGYSTDSVVQLTFSLLLELCYRTQRHSDAAKGGKWSESADFCFWDYPLTELAGKTIGIIGLGSIGQKVADVAAAFGMQVIASSRTETDQTHRQNFRWVSRTELFKQSDVITLHCPLTPETENSINAASLALMKTTAKLINTSRGALVQAQDLADALNQDRLSGAGLDVLATEPPSADNPLLQAKNCIITPHIGWATKEARIRLLDTVVQNIQAYQQGNPVNVL